MATTNRTPPVMITLMIVFIAVTAGFSLMLGKATTRIGELLGSNGETRSAIPGIKAEGTDLRNRIAEKSATEALLKREIKRLDSHLGKHRVYMAGDKVVTAVATTSLPESGGKTLDPSSQVVAKQIVNGANTRLEERAKVVAGDTWQKWPTMDELIGKRQEQLADLQKKVSDLEAAWRTDSEDLNTRQEKLTLTSDKALRKHNEDISTRQTKIGKLEVKIRQLLELELHWIKDLEPVGRILETNVNNPRVIVNLGARDKVIPGMLFEVFQYDRGQYHEKGMIEVVEVRSQISLCRVLKVLNNKTWPLAKNDYIGNPIFSADRPKVFVVAGDFIKFGRSDIEGFIRQTGAVVRDRLSPGVDYLVAGFKDSAAREKDRAREFQVVAMNEDNILKYIRAEFRPVATVATTAVTGSVTVAAEAAPAPENAKPAEGAAPAVPADKAEAK